MYWKRNSDVFTKIIATEKRGIDWRTAEHGLGRQWTALMRCSRKRSWHGKQKYWMRAWKSLVLQAVSKLRDRECLIMELRFGLNGRKEHTQKQVADKLGISQSYISRLEKENYSPIKNWPWQSSMIFVWTRTNNIFRIKNESNRQFCPAALVFIKQYLRDWWQYQNHYYLRHP